MVPSASSRVHAPPVKKAPTLHQVHSLEPNCTLRTYCSVALAADFTHARPSLGAHSTSSVKTCFAAACLRRRSSTPAAAMQHKASTMSAGSSMLRGSAQVPVSRVCSSSSRATVCRVLMEPTDQVAAVTKEVGAVQGTCGTSAT